MIKLHISSRNFELDAKIVAYAHEKIGGLERYLPRSQKNTEGRVILAEDASGREDNRYICEAEIQLQGPNAEAREATLNMYAAIDIVEAKLKVQILRYKEKHSHRFTRSRRFIARLRRNQE